MFSTPCPTASPPVHSPRMSAAAAASRSIHLHPCASPNPALRQTHYCVASTSFSRHPHEVVEYYDLALPMPTKSKSKKPRRIPVRTSSCEWPNDLPPLEYGPGVEAEVASSSSLSARALAAEKSLERATSVQEWPKEVWSTDNLAVDSKGKGKQMPHSTLPQGLSLHKQKDDGSEGSDSVTTERSQRTAEGAATLTPKGCEGEQTPVYARSPPKGETSTLSDASLGGRALEERSRRRSDGGLGLVGIEEALGREEMRAGVPRALDDRDEDEREARLGSATEISRTPSQSTTGTTDSSNIDSLDTAASSLRSSTSAALHEVKAPRRTSPEPSTESSTVTLTTETALEDDDDDDEDKTEELHEAAVDDYKKLSHLRRYHALMELVETENGYAEDLATLVNVFFANLTSQPFFIEDSSRVEGVVRNTGELLDLHSKLARQLNRIVHDCGLNAECAGSDVEKAADRSETAVKRIAQRLQRLASRFDVYKHFCARHAEALVLIREAEKRHNGDDFATFERMCGNIVRGGVFTSPTSSRPNSGPSSPNPQALASDMSSFTASATSSPSLHDDAPPTFARQQTTGRLHFADYLIKPIQRLCLYPLVLNSLLKHTSADELATRHAIEAAAAAMKKVADSVDDASKQRQREIVSELISTRVEPQQSITQTFLRSLGIPDLAGTVDVLHHNESIRPLLSPLRFEHRGIVLWSGWLLIVKVRKTQQLEPRFWFPLAGVKLSHSEDPNAPFSWPTSASNAAGHQPIVRHALRLTYGKMHHFELSFSTAKELALWSRELSRAKQARTTDQGLDYPTNLTDFDDGRQVAIRRALERGASPEHRASLALEPMVPEADDALTAFFATHASANTSVESLVKLWTTSAKALTNRNMVFTDTVLGAVQGESASQGEGMGPLLLTRDLSEQVIAQQLRQSTGTATPSFGAAVGAAMGKARKTASAGMENVKRVRRQSSSLMLNTAALPLSTATEVVDSPTDTSSPEPMGTTSRRDSVSSTWKASMLRMGTPKMRPLSTYIPANGASAQRSLPVSPISSSMELPRIDTVLPVVSRSTNASPRSGHPRSMSMALRDAWSQTSSSATISRGRSNSTNSVGRHTVLSWDAPHDVSSGQMGVNGVVRHTRSIRNRASSIIGDSPTSTAMEIGHSSNTNNTSSSSYASARSSYASAQSSRAPSLDMGRDGEDMGTVKKRGWSSTLQRARTSISRPWNGSGSDLSSSKDASHRDPAQDHLEATKQKQRGKIERSATEVQLSQRARRSGETRRGSLPLALSSASSSSSSLYPSATSAKQSSPIISPPASSSSAHSTEGQKIKRRLSSRFLQQVRLTPTPSTTSPAAVSPLTASSKSEATTLNPVEETSIEYNGQMSPPLAESGPGTSVTRDSYFSSTWSLKHRPMLRPAIFGRSASSTSPYSSTASSTNTSTMTTNASNN